MEMDKGQEINKRRAGQDGERQVQEILASLPEETYTVRNDLLLRTKHGTVQIDHLVISPYMIFVIETKNYAGTVTGTDRDELWIQHSGRESGDGGQQEEKRAFYNPVRQNFTHIQALIQLFKPVVGTLPMLSVVAFPAGCTLQIHTRSHVIRFGEIIDVIAGYHTVMISREKKEKIISFLDSANITDPAARKKHAASVNRKMKKTRG